MGCKPSLDFPISDFLNAISIIRTTHAPSLALALGVGRTYSFSSCKPEAVGGLYGPRRPVLWFPSNSGLTSLIESQV